MTLRVVQPPQFTADELVAEIRARGGRVYRMREIVVFCLTNDPEVAEWIFRLGGVSFVAPHAGVEYVEPPGAYKRASGGPLEWDIFIHVIPVIGEKRVWEAAGPLTFVSHQDAHAHGADREGERPVSSLDIAQYAAAEARDGHQLALQPAHRPLVGVELLDAAALPAAVAGALPARAQGTTRRGARRRHRRARRSRGELLARRSRATKTCRSSTCSTGTTKSAGRRRWSASARTRSGTTTRPCPRPRQGDALRVPQRRRPPGAARGRRGLRGGRHGCLGPGAGALRRRPLLLGDRPQDRQVEDDEAEGVVADPGRCLRRGEGEAGRVPQRLDHARPGTINIVTPLEAEATAGAPLEDRARRAVAARSRRSRPTPSS